MVVALDKNMEFKKERCCEIRCSLLTLLAALLLFAAAVRADLGCDILTSCPSDSTALLYFENDSGGVDDAHAELPDSPTSPYVLCCNSTVSAITSSCGINFLKLSDVSNAHAHAPSYEDEGDYPFNACITADTNVSSSCTVSTTGCTSLTTCLLSIESDEDTNLSNAHVGSCLAFDTDVCCYVNAYPENVTLYSPANGTTNLTDITPFFTWYNTSDLDALNLSYQLQVAVEGVGFDNLTDNVSDISEGTNLTTYSPSTELSVGVTYVWRVRGFDGIDYGNWSENWTFTIEALTTTITSTGGGGGGGGSARSSQLVTIDLIHAGNISTVEGQRVITPIIVNNTNPSITLLGINLSVISADEFINAQLSPAFIEKLAPGESQTVDLIVESNSSGLAELSVVARVGQPSLTDSVKFYITTLPPDIAEIQTKIKFVKDLFKQNPRCLELNDLVFRAEKASDSGNYTEAAAILDKAISKCKDLITHKEPEQPLTPKSREYMQRFLFLAILTLITTITLVYRIRKMMIKKREKEDNG